MAILAVAVNVFSQSNDFEVITCTEFHKTIPVRQMKLAEVKELPLDQKVEMPDRIRRIPYMYSETENKATTLADGSLQSWPGTKLLDTTGTNFNGQVSNSYPPDPTGAAGIEYYVQAINSQYRVYKKDGTTVSGGGPFTLGSLLYSTNDGDPIVLYDKYADRWFISQFKTSGNKVLIAISQTSDPLGSYYTYQFTSPQFPDYLKFSIWSDGYYMTSNQSSQKVFVFERDSMLAGVSTSRSLYKTYSPPDAGYFFCPLPGDADGQLPPAGTPCPIFSYEDDGWGSNYTDRINVYEMAVTWGTTPAATITLAAQLPTAAFDASYNSNWNDISQPGTSGKLDGIGGVFTFRAQYRRWTGYNSVVLNHVVKATTTQIRGIRWYELRENATTGVWSIYQQGTYSPDNNHRWVGSIAMDDNGSIGLAFAISSSAIYPSIRVTGREPGDSLGIMTFKEWEPATGSSSQSYPNRFGDYSHTSLDPSDGKIFWHTGEYLYNNKIGTRVFSWSIPRSNVSVDNFKSEATLNVYQSDKNLVITANNLPVEGEINLDIFDITGKLLKSNIVQTNEIGFTQSIGIDNLPKGTYLVRIGKTNTSFQKVKKININ